MMLKLASQMYINSEFLTIREEVWGLLVAMFWTVASVNWAVKGV